MVRNYKRKTEDRWTKEDLLEALTLIKDSKLKINDAARQFGISRATLYRQFQKFLQAGGKCDINQFRTCGGNPILTKVEEDVLEKTIIDLRDQGFSVTSSDIKRICFEYCDSNTIPNQFNPEKRMASDDWYYGFLKRHPEVRSGRLSGGVDLMSSETNSKRRKIRDEGDTLETSKDRRRKKKLKKWSPSRSKKNSKGKRSEQKSTLTIVNATGFGAESETILAQIKQENGEFMEMEDTSPHGSEESTEVMMGDNNNGETEDREEQEETDAESESAQKDSDDDEDDESENGGNDYEGREIDGFQRGVEFKEEPE